MLPFGRCHTLVVLFNRLGKVLRFRCYVTRRSVDTGTWATGSNSDRSAPAGSHCTIFNTTLLSPKA